MAVGFARAARPGDAGAIEALLLDAFGGPGEAALASDLRDTGQIVVELVLAVEGRIIAHVALSRMVAPEGWLCLAPLAVAAGWRGRGVGLRMAKAVVALVVALAVGRTVVVLGKPSFYARAGFSRARVAALQSPYRAENMLISRPGEDVPDARLIYPAAFTAV